MERVFSSHQLIEAARTRLNASSYPAVRGLSCASADGGILYLRGRVSSYYQKQLAQEAVVDLPGVVEVVNQAEVVGRIAARAVPD